MAEKIEVSRLEAIFAMGFIALVLVCLYLAMTGIIASPLTLGLLVVLTVVLLFLGQALVRAKIIARPALPLWYTMVLGLILLIYGAIQAGYLPVAVAVPGASVMEVAITSSLLYAIFVLSIFAAIAAGYAAYKYYKTRYG